ncbi:hypothetical protein H0H93_010267 [Arthromyces matolae]|nr:hypothetical protein H0H93_010267 [Arthromyces matolae]
MVSSLLDLATFSDHFYVEKKLTDHTTSAVKRREPTITRLARLYNEHCATITRMINDKKAPRRAQCPPKIDLKGLFSLDVDSDIWRDVDVEDDDASRSEPPAWLAVENVREGIKALLERDRCVEEEKRLLHECRSMVQWFSEEWKSLDFGDLSSLPEWGPSIQDQLEIRIAQSTASVADEESDLEEEEEEDLDIDVAQGYDSESDLFDEF